MPIRAVFDCMLYLQAVTNEHGVAFKCFRLAEEKKVTLAVSPAILAEVRDVLGRDYLARKFRTLTVERTARFLDRVLAFAELSADPPNFFDLPRDPNDERYLDLAIEKSSHLVTWNERHLTYLMRKDTPEGVDFCQRFPDVKIVDPVSFTRIVEAAQGV